MTSKEVFEKLGDPRNEGAKTLRVHYMPERLVKAFSHCERFPVKLYCHEKLFKCLVNALDLILYRGLEKELKTFDGCYNVRPIRGNKDWSMHSWAIAVDWNAETNKLGTKGDMKPEVVTCFESCGFKWGGDFKRCDPMHFELESL